MTQIRHQNVSAFVFAGVLIALCFPVLLVSVVGPIPGVTTGKITDLQRMFTFGLSTAGLLLALLFLLTSMKVRPLLLGVVSTCMLAMIFIAALALIPMSREAGLI